MISCHVLSHGKPPECTSFSWSNNTAMANIMLYYTRKAYISNNKNKIGAVSKNTMSTINNLVYVCPPVFVCINISAEVFISSKCLWVLIT